MHDPETGQLLSRDTCGCQSVYPLSLNRCNYGHGDPTWLVDLGGHNAAQVIGTLKVGDQVTAYDPATGTSSTQTVQHVWVNHDHDLLDVTLHADGQEGHATEASSSDKTQQVATKAHGSQAPPPPSDETIHTTAKHPWLTTDRGWVTAGDLHVGEQVVELGGRTATITALHVRPGAATYYNLTVSQLHTYAVGASQAVVHNIGGEGLCLFENRYPERLQSELARADSLGVEPLKPGEPGFQQMTQQGTLKWVLKENGELKFMPKYVGDEEIPHTALSRGAPVQDAGEVKLTYDGRGGYTAEDFSHWSGHYWPDPDLPLQGGLAFRNAGIRIPGFWYGY